MPLLATGFEAGSAEYYRRFGWALSDGQITRKFAHRKDGYGGKYSARASFSDPIRTVQVANTARWLHFWLDRGAATSWSNGFNINFNAERTTQVQVQVALDGTISIFRGTTTLLATSATQIDMNRGHWVAIETVIDNSSGVCRIYVDDEVTARVEYTGDTQQSNLTTSNWTWATFGSNSGADGYIDDVIITDNSEGRQSEMFSKRIALTSDQDINLTPSVGASNVANVSTFDLATYNFTTATTTQDLYGVGGNVNLGVVQFVTVAAMVASQRSFQVQTALRSGATTSYGTLMVGAASQYQGILTFHLTDPDTTLAWTAEGVNTLQAGVRSGT